MRRLWNIIKAVYYRHQALKLFSNSFVNMKGRSEAPDSAAYLKELRKSTYFMKTEKVQANGPFGGRLERD